MEVIIGKTAGFCPGVSYAVKTAFEKVENEKIYCLGEIVHNGQVINRLESKGMITVETLDEVPDGSTVIFRAHGEAKSVYEKANLKDLNIVDLTCGKVRVIHNKVEKESEDSFILIVGKKTHPEIIGTKGFAGENSYVIENEDDILDAYMEYEKTEIGNVYVVAQTTFSSEKFDRLVEEIETNFIEADVKVDKTICDATEIRQAETAKLSKDVNIMVIIGGKHSSNTKELAKIAEENCGKVYLVETLDELKSMDIPVVDKIGIMAGASTPQDSIDEICKYLENK